MTQPRPTVPGPGQESCWDYPRPPRVEASSALVELELGGRTLARTTGALRVLETSHPPTYYLPRSAFHAGALRAAAGSSFCEWKGVAQYLDVVAEASERAGAAWYYPDPVPAYAALTGYVAVYPAAMDRALVDGEEVTPQPGGFYGGWITSSVTGPFKGAPGSSHW